MGQEAQLPPCCPNPIPSVYMCMFCVKVLAYLKRALC